LLNCSFCKEPADGIRICDQKPICIKCQFKDEEENSDRSKERGLQNEVRNDRKKAQTLDERKRLVQELF
jgi:hypothetical protein